MYDDELIELLYEEMENCGFAVDIDEYYKELRLQQYTPAGEDWHITLDLYSPNTKTYSMQLEELYEGPYDDLELHLPMRGKYGVPESAEMLVEDAMWKESQLRDLADTLHLCEMGY